MSLCSHFVIVLRASFVEMDVGRLGRLARPLCALYFRSFVDGGHAYAFGFTPPSNARHSILSVLVVCCGGSIFVRTYEFRFSVIELYSDDHQLSILKRRHTTANEII